MCQWLSRAVSLHELRHVLDGQRAGSGPLPCPICPASLDAPARAELSAYLASFAAPGVGVLALYQAAYLRRAFDESAEESAPHAAALAFALDALLSTRDGGPPADLAVRAR